MAHLKKASLAEVVPAGTLNPPPSSRVWSLITRPASTWIWPIRGIGAPKTAKRANGQGSGSKKAPHEAGQ